MDNKCHLRNNQGKDNKAKCLLRIQMADSNNKCHRNKECHLRMEAIINSHRHRLVITADMVRIARLKHPKMGVADLINFGELDKMMMVKRMMDSVYLPQMLMKIRMRQICNLILTLLIRNRQMLLVMHSSLAMPKCLLHLFALF